MERGPRPGGIEVERRASRSRTTSATSQDVEIAFHKQIAAVSPAERVYTADHLLRDVITAARSGIIASGRFATPEEVQRELVRRLHGDAMADEYFAHTAS